MIRKTHDSDSYSTKRKTTSMVNTESQPRGLRESLNRWNDSRSYNSQKFNDTTKGLFSNWTDSFNERVQDVYARLPISQQDLNQEQQWMKLNKTESIALFVCFILGAIGCFVLCIFLFPVLALQPRKFGLLWSMGSLLFILAFGVLQGPTTYIKHLLSKERLPFTIFFFGTCSLTIYFAAFAKNTILTIVCALLEIVAVIYYTISYFPFGATGLKILSSIGLSQARGALNI